MPLFKFDLDQIVKLAESDERGTVIGRALYRSNENNYLVRYKAGDLRQVEIWWAESALKAL